VVFIALAACTSSGCVDRGSGDPCEKDSDCSSGEGCDTEGGSNPDSYCALLCFSDDDCPYQYLCGERGTDKPQSDEVGDDPGGAGICDIYDGANGPNTCHP